MYQNLSENIEVVHYCEKYWNDVKSFIKNTWRKDHPMCNKDLFHWQFRGFGKEGHKNKTLLLLKDGKLIGFRGTIPALFQVPVSDNQMKVVSGGSSSMWSIDDRYRSNSRLGLLLLNESLKTMNVITGLGSEPKTSLPFYTYTGFNILDSMHRYIGPLDSQHYNDLLTTKLVNLDKILNWTELLVRSIAPVYPSQPNVEELAEVWKKTTFPLQIFSLYRNEEFWRWRYIESFGYKYLFFGEPKSTGVIVARIENIISKNYPKLNELKIFRIIEIIPSKSDAWNGKIDDILVSLLSGVIKWAKNQGCVAVDFYCSNNVFEKNISEVGMKKFDKEDPIKSLAIIFQPLAYKGALMNAFYKINFKRNRFNDLGFENSYFVKSDGDMDRPNILTGNVNK